MMQELPAGIMPDPRAQLPDLLVRNEGRWVSHEGIRPGVYRHVSTTGEECLTVRAQLPPGGALSAESCRRLADLTERYAQVARRTSRNALELVGVDPAGLDDLIAGLSALGYPVGGTGNSLHQIKSCSGFSFCQNSAIDSPAISKLLGDRLFGDVVAQRYPAHLKLSVGGCPNQCGGGVEADIGILGAFKGLPQVDDAAMAESRCDVPLLCFWCPTAAIRAKQVRGGLSVEINAEKCVRCSSCANVCPSAIRMSGQRGAAIFVGGMAGNTGRGPRLAKMLVPFIPVTSQLEIDPILDVVQRVVDVWVAGAERGERLGAYVERVGWAAFFRKAGVAPDLLMVDDFSPASIRRDLQMRW